MFWCGLYGCVHLWNWIKLNTDFMCTFLCYTLLRQKWLNEWMSEWMKELWSSQENSPRGVFKVSGDQESSLNNWYLWYYLWSDTLQYHIHHFFKQPDCQRCFYFASWHQPPSATTQQPPLSTSEQCPEEMEPIENRTGCQNLIQKPFVLIKTELSASC